MLLLFLAEKSLKISEKSMLKLPKIKWESKIHSNVNINSRLITPIYGFSKKNSQFITYSGIIFGLFLLIDLIVIGLHIYQRYRAEYDELVYDENKPSSMQTSLIEL